MADYNLNCSLALPYPPIVPTKLNRYDAQMLKALLAGTLCNINEYITQSIVFADLYPHFADIMDCIATGEALHFKLLLKLLLLSGEKWDMPGTASFCRKTNKRREQRYTPVLVTADNIEREKMYISDIKLVLSQLYSEEAKQLLERMLLEKEHHIGILSELSLRYM